MDPGFSRDDGPLQWQGGEGGAVPPRSALDMPRRVGQFEFPQHHAGLRAVAHAEAEDVRIAVVVAEVEVVVAVRVVASVERVARQARASDVIREEQRPLSALRWTPRDGAAAEMAPLIERQGAFMPTHGNAVTLLDDYDASLRALLDDIGAANRQVHLLYYLMFDDPVGEAVTSALCAAAARGVTCRVLLDAVGAKRGLHAYRARLRAAGVMVHDMLPGGLRWRRSGRMDLRNHRKVAVIDNRIGYVGSQNLAEATFVAGHPNRELVARVQGPVVSHLEGVFASDWYIETGERLEVQPDLSVQPQDVPAQLLPSGPAYPFENARDVFVALVQRARRRAISASMASTCPGSGNSARRSRSSASSSPRSRSSRRWAASICQARMNG